MATWKKVLIEGADLTNTTDFINNTSDIVAGTGISVTASSGNANNRLLGDDDDITFAVDVNGLSDLNAAPASGDFIIVHDISETTNPKVKKVSVTNLSATFDSGVSSLQLTGDSGNTGASPDTGAVVFDIEGGTGITTQGGTDKITVNADVATTSALGVAKFNSGNFAVDAGDVTIKGGGVDTAQLAASAVETAKIDNQAVTDAKINNAGISSPGKVSLTAVRFHNFGAHITDETDLHSSDRIILNDASDTHGSGDHNYTSTLGTLDAFIQDNSASFSTVHTSLSVGPAGAGFSLTGGNLVYVQNVTTDSTVTLPTCRLEPSLTQR